MRDDKAANWGMIFERVDDHNRLDERCIDSYSVREQMPHVDDYHCGSQLRIRPNTTSNTAITRYIEIVTYIYR